MRASLNLSKVGSRARTAAPLVALLLSTGCAAAAGAAMAAVQIQKGFAGLQQLLAVSREQPAPALALAIESRPAFTTPLAGTYRGYQALGDDTIHYYVRTTDDPVAPIVDQAGTTTGYALAGIAATSLDSLEACVRQRSDGYVGHPGGAAVFFVEGVQPPSPGARALYPAAFLGKVAPGESEAADRQDAELRQLELELAAPESTELAATTIPHELFGTVAEGVFTLHPDGAAAYRQEYQVEDGRMLVLQFERISETTLP